MAEELKKREVYEEPTDESVTECEVRERIKKLTVSTIRPVDMITTEVLNMGADSLSGPLARLLNRTQFEGISPEEWQTTAVFMPLFKGKWDPLGWSNYRLLSLLSAVWKLFESIRRACE